MSLLRDVIAVLEAEDIPHALVGAAALAVHGVSRATADMDLLTVDARALQRPLWSGIESRGARLRLLEGDPEDPLLGGIRLSLPEGGIVDVIVGRFAWQREIVEASELLPIGELSVRVARPAGLVLLKLYAGGPKDAWDIRALLESHEQAAAIETEVDRLVSCLPAESRRLWELLRAEPQ